MMIYNPYDLIDLLINGKKIHGRPIAFDSDITNHKTMENAFGNYVKPTKLSSCCPDCGQGLEFEVVLNDPPFDVVILTCYHCKPQAPSSPDPFMNPLDDGRIPIHDLDPLLHDPNAALSFFKYVVNDDGNESSVADRIQFDIEDDEDIVGNIVAGSFATAETEDEIQVSEVSESTAKAMVTETTKEVVEIKTTTEPQEMSEIKKESKEIPLKKNKVNEAKKPLAKKPKIAIEPADGLTAEIELDDLAEQE